jgi:hypothetical protein
MSEHDTDTDTDTDTDGRDLSREITIRGKRYIWEQHASGAHVIDLVMLQDDSPTLAACGALVLAYPRFASRAGFKRSVSKAAGKLYDLLVANGWEVGDIMRAGTHAFSFLAEDLPVTPKDEGVEEALDFSEPQPASTPAGS